MLPSLPFYLSASFFALTVLLLLLLLAGLYAALRRTPHYAPTATRLTVRMGLGLLFWMGLLWILAQQGFFANFDARPPRIFMILIALFGSLFAVTRLRSVGTVLDHTPPSWLVYPQAFRVPMELILWGLFLENIIPVQMTFEGLNFDVLVGLTAPVAAYFCFQRPLWSRTVALGWNVFGLVLLTTIVVVAILSAPTPFRQFMNEPANTMIAGTPFVWLPGFVVPFAYVLHALSLRQLWRQRPPTAA